MDKYPRFKKRREEFVKDVRLRNSTGISLGCWRMILFAIFILILTAIFLYLWSHGYSIGYFLILMEKI